MGKEIFKLIVSLIKLSLRLAFCYSLCLLFTHEFNPLDWSAAAKIVLVVLVFLFLNED